MNLFAFSRFSFARAAVVAASIAVGCVAWQQARAAAGGPFADFPGIWEGNGKIQIGDKTERIRCKGKYSLRADAKNYVLIEITCASDSYKFDLSGNFQADLTNGINGTWSENSRGVGGSATGTAKGDRFQLHFESTAITGNMVMTTRKNSQKVTIDTIGTKEKISASIALRRISE
jgi:hypothetical protein